MIEIELLKNKIPKKYPIVTIILIMFLITLILSFKTNSYDKYKTIAITNNINNTCHLNVSIPYNKLNNIKQSKIEYQNKQYIIKEISYNKTSIENNIPYEDTTITINTSCKDKIVDINILSNKQRIINKIINIIREE